MYFHNHMKIENRKTRTPAFWGTLRRPMITHTSYSHQIPKQDKVKVTNLKKKCQTLNFEILQETLHVTHLLKLLDKMYKYEVNPTRTVGATERTRDAGRTDGRSEINIPPTISLYADLIKLRRLGLFVAMRLQKLSVFGGTWKIYSVIMHSRAVLIFGHCITHVYTSIN